MYECRARIAGCELLRHETIHRDSMFRAFRTRECILELEIIEVELAFTAGAEDGEGSGEVWGRGGGGREEGSEVGNEAHSGEVV